MKYPSLKFFNKLNVAVLRNEELVYYAYVLTCCQYPASVVGGEWCQLVDDVCNRKITELREEINRRFEREDKTDVLANALAVINGTVNLVKTNKEWINSTHLTLLSDTELIELYSMSKCWYDMRRCRGIEVFTRSYQWRIVNELLSRKDSGILAQILQLTEFIEADNYAHNINLPYNIGDGVKSFVPSCYASDEDLRRHINVLALKADYISREELIQIADYIQTEIVDKGETARHMDLVNAILCTGMPYFAYPEIVKDLEKTIKYLAKSKEKKDIELAPYFYSLWGLTERPSYLSRFEKTVRQCYLTLANDKHYPDLGVSIEDSDSLASALQFLNEYRLNVWILNDKYDVDKVIVKYQSYL